MACSRDFCCLGYGLQNIFKQNECSLLASKDNSSPRCDCPASVCLKASPTFIAHRLKYNITHMLGCCRLAWTAHEGLQ